MSRVVEKREKARQMSASITKTDQTDKQLVLSLVAKMDDRVTVKTIAERLYHLDSARALAIYFVENNLVDAETIAQWIGDFTDQYTSPKYER